MLPNGLPEIHGVTAEGQALADQCNRALRLVVTKVTGSLARQMGPGQVNVSTDNDPDLEVRLNAGGGGPTSSITAFTAVTGASVDQIDGQITLATKEFQLVNGDWEETDGADIVIQYLPDSSGATDAILTSNGTTLSWEELGSC